MECQAVSGAKRNHNKRLTATGYGKSKLLLPEQPFNALNCRVEFRNIKGVAPTETINK